MKSKTKHADTASKIKEFFLHNAYRMKIYPAHHFALRVYRTTGQDDMRDTILANVLKDKTRVLNDILNHNDKGYVKKRSEELYAVMRKKKGKKEAMRQRFFAGNKEYLFYYNLIEQLYFWRCFGVSRSRFKPFFEQGIGILRKEADDIKSYILDEDAVRCFGTQIVNYVYFLLFFGICDIREDFKKVWQSIFMGTDDMEAYMYKNKIYGMTHFIIAGSDYYQDFADRDEFQWILDYFEEHIDDIMERTHVDIIAEVGLCIRLCGVDSGRALDVIKDYVAGSYDPSRGFIPRRGFVPASKATDINVAEHTNAVAFMLLNGFKELYRGPDLSEEFDAEVALGEAP